MAVRLVAQDLVAEGDGVVVEPGGQMPVGGHLVILHRSVHIADPPIQITDPIVQRQIDVLACLPIRLQGRLVRLDRALPVLALLERPRLLSEMSSVAHSPFASCLVWAVSAPTARSIDPSDPPGKQNRLP